MKKTIFLIVIVIILISCLVTTTHAEKVDFSYNTSITPLRAGGGSSGGGGSSSGGGGSSSHSYHTTRGQPTPLQSILLFIIMPFVLFSSSIIFYIKLTKRSRKAKKLIKKMMLSDNAWKYKDISTTVENSFIAIQTAWSNMDMAPASQYMSDELYDNFQTKLSWMACRNQKNVLDNIKLVQALPVAVHDDSDNSRDYIWFYIKGKMVDYIIDTDTQLKISGNTSSTSFVEYWQFTRKENNWVLNKILQKNETEQIPFTE